MSNRSLVLRVCMSGKTCTKCSREIGSGNKYWSGPYKSLCIGCYEKDKIEQKKPQTTENDTATVSGNCKFCSAPAIGILWGNKVCGAHINQAITDSV